MAAARSIWSLLAPVTSILAVAAMSGLALHAVIADAAAHDDHVAALEAQLLTLEGEFAAQADEISALQKKHTRPRPTVRKGRPDPAAVYAIPISDAPVRGPSNAPITLVEYTDFQCPFCARVQPTIAKLEERYGDQLRVVFKHHPLPFHKRADPAAIAADCAGEQGRFFEMEALLWQNNRQLTDDDLRDYAESVRGLRLPAWQACVDDAVPAAHIKRDMDEASRFGVVGTPAFFVNGRFLSGAQPYERFTALVDEELKRYRASDVSAASYYEEQILGHGLQRVE